MADKGNCCNCNVEIAEDTVRMEYAFAPPRSKILVCKKCDSFVEDITIFSFLLACHQGKTLWKTLRKINE